MEPILGPKALWVGTQNDGNFDVIFGVCVWFPFSDSRKPLKSGGGQRRGKPLVNWDVKNKLHKMWG